MFAKYCKFLLAVSVIVSITSAAPYATAGTKVTVGRPVPSSQRKSMVASAWRTQVSRVEPLPAGVLSSLDDDDPDEDTNV